MPQISDFAHDALGVTLYAGQQEVIDAYYDSGLTYWLCLAGRRGGKSLMADIIVCHEAIVPAFGDVLRPGEERYVIVVSTRQDNANLHIRNIARMLKHTKAARSMIRTVGKDRIELSNDVVILSLPASARAGRGYTASTLIFDELAWFVDTDGNASGDAVFDAFAPTLATFGERGRIVITTTPGAPSGVVFDLFDRRLQEWFITRKATRELNPKVSERTIESARTRNPESAAVEYDAEFAEPVAAYLSGDAISQAIDPARTRADSAGVASGYVMAIDPATMADRYGFVVCHRDGKRIVCDYAQVLYPPVDPNAAEELLFDIARRFRPYRVRCDTAATAMRLQGRLPMDYTPFSRPLKLRIYGALKEALNLGTLSLYNEHELIDELHALQIRNGVDIGAPKAGRVTHDDLADCLALCVDELTSGHNSAPAGVLARAVDSSRSTSRWNSTYGDPQRSALRREARDSHRMEWRRRVRR